MSDVDSDRRQRLDIDLQQAMVGSEPHNEWWPIWYWADEPMRNWNQLLPELHRECKDGGGKITDYYVRTFVDFASNAIPVIDEIENENV